MKVALVMGACASGECGVGDYTRLLARSLRSFGLDTEVIDQGRWGLLDVRAMGKTLSQLRPDIVHIQYPTTAFGNRLGPQALALTRSCVITFHEMSQAHILRKLSSYAFFLRPQHLIFPSEYECQFAKKVAPWIGPISSVIPIGSNIGAASTTRNRRYDEVAYFGLIMPQKGLEQIVQLAKLIHAAGSPLKIRIIGNARHQTYAAQLRHQTEGLPIVWQTNLGHDEVADELAACSLAYLPFPDGASDRRASLMAMLTNGVVAITSVGAHTPKDLSSAVKFSSSPEDAFATIRRLLENPPEQEKLRRNAIQYMRQFSWDRITALHFRVYERVARSQTPAKHIAANAKLSDTTAGAVEFPRENIHERLS
jgi:glycosyltransferase involved in cell wall biosynthesis